MAAVNFMWAFAYNVKSVPGPLIVGILQCEGVLTLILIL